jgi:hypothetical protein
VQEVREEERPRGGGGVITREVKGDKLMEVPYNLDMYPLVLARLLTLGGIFVSIDIVGKHTNLRKYFQYIFIYSTHV